MESDPSISTSTTTAFPPAMAIAAAEQRDKNNDDDDHLSSSSNNSTSASTGRNSTAFIFLLVFLNMIGTDITHTGPHAIPIMLLLLLLQ